MKFGTKVHTHIFSFRKYIISFSTMTSLILLMSKFFCEKSENIPFSIKTSILMVPTFFPPKNQYFRAEIVPLLKAIV